MRPDFYEPSTAAELELAEMLPQLDEAMWNGHPRFNQKGSFFVNPAGANHFGGSWKRKLATNDIQGFEKYLVEFCTDSRPTKRS